MNEADLFDAFRVSTTIHGRYYKDTHTILGKTYGVCVLQDFEGKFLFSLRFISNKFFTYR